jgi:glycine cleavage system H protein
MDEKKLKYTESHEWVSVDGDVATIGISNHAQEELGDIVYVEVKEVGEEVEQFEEIGSIESVKAVSELKSPISGEISEINSELEKKPEKVNKEPYESGWIVKIKMSNKSELDSLMNFDKYNEFVENS